MMLKHLGRTLGSAAVAGLLASSASAQTKPDFSGTWRLVTDVAPPAALTLLSPLWTSPFVLTQSAGTLAVHAVGATASEAYFLDDGDHRVNATDVVHATWKENTIVIRFTHSTESVPTIISQSLTLDGGRLIVKVVSARGTRQLPPVISQYVRDAR